MHVAEKQYLILSDFILDELLAFAKHASPKTPRKMLRLIRQTLELYVEEVVEDETVDLRDTNDIPIIQLAKSQKALVLASDKDLLESEYAATLPVISVDEYLELFDLKR